MGKRGPQPTGQTTEVIRIKKTTCAAIRRLSDELGISQSEVVDRAMALLIDAGAENAMKEEQSQ